MTLHRERIELKIFHAPWQAAAALVCALLLFAHFILWWYVSGQVQQAFEVILLSSVPKEGYDVVQPPVYKMGRSGYPFWGGESLKEFRVVLRNQDTGEVTAWETHGKIKAYTPLWNPTRVRFVFSNAQIAARVLDGNTVSSAYTLEIGGGLAEGFLLQGEGNAVLNHVRVFSGLGEDVHLVFEGERVRLLLSSDRLRDGLLNADVRLTAQGVRVQPLGLSDKLLGLDSFSFQGRVVRWPQADARHVLAAYQKATEGGDVESEDGVRLSEPDRLAVRRSVLTFARLLYSQHTQLVVDELALDSATVGVHLAGQLGLDQGLLPVGTLRVQLMESGSAEGAAPLSEGAEPPAEGGASMTEDGSAVDALSVVAFLLGGDTLVQQVQSQGSADILLTLRDGFLSIPPTVFLPVPSVQDLLDGLLPDESLEFARSELFPFLAGLSHVDVITGEFEGGLAPLPYDEATPENPLGFK